MWSIFWNKSTTSTKRNTQISYELDGSRLSLYPGTRFCVDPPKPEKHLQTVPEVLTTVSRAVSIRPDESSVHESHEVSKKAKLAVKSESESCSTSTSPKTSPLEPRRKSLLEEKRAIFQRRRFDSSSSTSDDTMIAVTVDEDTRRHHLDKEQQSKQEKSKKTARHISVRKFDTFSTFEGTFDEDAGVGYLAGIEEEYRESCDKPADDFANFHQEDMAHATTEHPEKSRSVSQDSAVRFLYFTALALVSFCYTSLFFLYAK